MLARVGRMYGELVITSRSHSLVAPLDYVFTKFGLILCDFGPPARVVCCVPFHNMTGKHELLQDVILICMAISGVRHVV